MTVDTEFGAHGTDEQIHAERLHEFCVNTLGYNTYDVLATAHSDGKVTLTIDDGVEIDE